MHDPIVSLDSYRIPLEAVEFLIQTVLADRNSVYYVDFHVIEPEYSRGGLRRGDFYGQLVN